MSAPYVHLEGGGMVWSCVCCGTIYGGSHDPFRRCSICDEACYTRCAVEAAIERRDRKAASRALTA